MSSRLYRWGFLLLLLIVNSVSATIVNVPGDYVTIQEGIDASVDGDTVLVGSGTYLDSINIQNKSLTLMGMDSSATIISADEILVQSSTSHSVKIKDMKFLSSDSGSDLIVGAGCHDCPVGDTLFLDLESIAVDGNHESRFLKEAQNTFLTIRNSSFQNMYAANGDGSVLDLRKAKVVIDHSQFLNNSADGEGQVIHASEQSSVKIDFSSFSGNGDNPGALAISDGSSLTVSNSILWGTPNFQLVIPDIGDPCTADISYSDISNGLLGIDDQSGDLSLTWGSGNINQNPRFVSLTDLSLQSTSSCIDAGDPGAQLDEDNTRADMGAYYYDHIYYSPLISISADTLVFNVNTADSVEQSQTITISNNGLSPLEVSFFINSEMVTDIDGNTYKTVKIGDQVWMAENLMVTHYRDGSPITNVTDNDVWEALTTEAYCFYDNDSNLGMTFGALYNWYALAHVGIIAPEGWHIPSNDEIVLMEIELGMSPQDANSYGGFRGTTEGSKLAGTRELWEYGGLTSHNDFGTSGFNLLPGGYRSSATGIFGGINSTGNLWAGDGHYGRYVTYQYTFLQSNVYEYGVGRSVRCIKDEPNDSTIWLSTTPAILAVPPGENHDVLVNINCEGFELGDYFDLITISSDDFTNPIVELPVSMSVVNQDTIPPEVHLNVPEITAPVYNGDTLTIIWTASDNVALDWAKLFFTADEGATFDLYDSVDANPGEIDWIAPDLISNRCNFAIWVCDSYGNITADTLDGSFSINDSTLPTITILHPIELTSVKEGDSLYVSWEASDNVGLDWFELWLSKNPSEDFVNLIMIPGDSMSFAFGIGHGVSDSARIKMTVMDVAHNLAEDYSDYFSITDNTAPVISFLGIPDTVEWGIGSVLDLWVIASDNVEVTGLDLSYSADEGATWLPIIEDLYPVQGRPTYSWLIPNTPGDCQVRAVVSDAVGLTDTSYSEEFSIIVEYPQLVASLPEIRPDGDLSLAFSQPIDSLNFSTAASVTGSVFGEYEISGELNGVYATISVPNGFVSLDTLRLVLFASEWTNRYGYGLDGNGDGAFDGNGADNDTIYFTVNAAGDYNQDDALDFEDFDDFITAWHHDVVDYELAPHQGTIPHISIQPDSSFDIYDLATFASMWNWAAGMSPSAPMTETFPYETFTTEQNGNTLSISVPQADYRASQTIIKYDPNLVAINLTDPGLAKVSSSALSFVDVNPDSGYILITSSQLNEIEDELLNFTLIPSTRHRYSIEIAFQGSNGADNPIQKRSVVELLPIPTSFSLWQNYPNPFNASTSIEYALPMNTELNISIYDIRGRFVRDIYSGEKPAGYHLTQWNGTTDAGQNVASGVYFIVLQTPEYIGTEKLLLLK